MSSPLFRVLYYHVSVVIGKKGKTHKKREATVKVKVNGVIEHKVAEGDGPVNALDIAFRLALEPHFPELSSMRLCDFWVRITNHEAGTAAYTEVLAFSKNGSRSWMTRGASSDIIEASAIALIESFRIAIRKKRKTQVPS